LRSVLPEKIPEFDLTKGIYYTSHETMIPSDRRQGLPRADATFVRLMHHNAQHPGAYFKIPGAQIMKIGVEFEV
jgi:K+ transporter